MTRSGLPHGELTRSVLRELASGPRTVTSIASALRLDTSLVGNTLANLARRGRIQRAGMKKGAILWVANGPSTASADEGKTHE